jgi:hypothetical protein
MMLAVLAASVAVSASAQNPIIMNQFTADPDARVFDGKVYLYPSHDIRATDGQGRPGWFCMQDYHVFSSSDLTDWQDHGVIVSQDKVPWVKQRSYSMWAPDCFYRNGKYYFYFPSMPKDSSHRKGFAIGVAISDKPYGPFTPQPEPVSNVHGIDPNVLVDKDGQAYLVWAEGDIYIARLKKDMLHLEGTPHVIGGLPEKGLKEGPFMFERKGIYYLIYPHVQDKTERLEYAISDDPMGPFKVTGVIMDATPDCWTNQASVIKYKGQWYLFYHHNYLSPDFDKNRSVAIDSLFFNTDGTIRKVRPSLRGVGLTPATAKIQVDRYSAKSKAGASIAFLDPSDVFKGWKTVFNGPNAWVRYNAVAFGSNPLKSVSVRAQSETGGVLQLRLDKQDGPVVARVQVPASATWSNINVPLSSFKKGRHNLIVESTGDKKVEIDWVRFR